jgi:protein phosphatase
MEVDLGAASAIGKRSENQDRWAIADDGRWAAVSDGVGGAAGGAEAAQIAIEAASGVLQSGRPIAEAFVAAHSAVCAAQSVEVGLAHMAATLTIAARLHDVWFVAGAGDSPAFLFGRSARRLLVPHTLAESLVTAGAISREEGARHPGRNSITRGIGHRSSSLPDVVEVSMAPGDTIVLASDGVEVLTGAEMERVVLGAATASDAAGALVSEALTAGARDNVTAVVIRTFVTSTE